MPKFDFRPGDTVEYAGMTATVWENYGSYGIVKCEGDICKWWYWRWDGEDTKLVNREGEKEEVIAERVTRQQVADACKDILTAKTYDALIQGRFPLPTIMKMAAEAAFVFQLTGEFVDILRRGMVILREDGFLN